MKLPQTATCVFLLAVLAMLFGVANGEKAKAQGQRENYCKQLSLQLTNVGLPRAVGGNSRKYREYDDAVRRQQLQISKTRSVAKRGGCLRRGIFKNRSAQCKRIVSGLERMTANLESLRQARAQFAPRQVGSSRQRDAILRQMREFGCEIEGYAQIRPSQNVARQQPRRRSIIEQIFGVRTYGDDGRRRADDFGPNYDLAAQYGTYRTLCVRRTDGYYFPISFSTVPQRFDIDEQTCYTMCAGTDVGLYYHRMPIEDSEDMVSYRTDVPYAKEPFAFAYREKHDPENKCRFSTAGMTQSVDADPDGDLEENPRNQEIRIGIPEFRIDPSLSPDAYDSAQEGIDTDTVMTFLRSTKAKDPLVSSAQPETGRKIRIVGPAFYPVQ